MSLARAEGLQEAQLRSDCAVNGNKEPEDCEILWLFPS